MQCRFCGAENDDDANFCRMCGKKQREVCNCGIKKKPYNCGQEKCPGYRLFLMEARKAREAASASHNQSAIEKQGLDIDVDRLGLAYWRLNRWEWDEILGPKPEGFDELPNWWEKRWPWERRKPSKSDYIQRPIRQIRSLIGEVNISRCWLKYEYSCEDQWLQYYLTGNIYISRSNGE